MAEVSKQWYVINSYTGHENTVKDNLIRRIETMNVQNNIFRVIVAEEEVPVLKDGMPTGKTKIKNTYPGYVFVEMIMSDEAWFVVRNTPGVTGFVGSSGKGAKPFPVPKEQIESVLKKIGIVMVLLRLLQCSLDVNMLLIFHFKTLKKSNYNLIRSFSSFLF